MAQRRHHYERAFEEFLRAKRIPYVAVDEARKALLPENAPLKLNGPAASAAGAHAPTPPSAALKSFDFVIYSSPTNLLIDIKGRKVPERTKNAALGGSPGRLENWVTQADIDSLTTWQALFGPEFKAAFVFVYWCETQPPDALFQEILEHRGLWYALRAVTLDDYAANMKTRSPRWGTVDLKSADFERISHPFTSWLETRTVVARPARAPVLT